jgi:hypothetical protein
MTINARVKRRMSIKGSPVPVQLAEATVKLAEFVHAPLPLGRPLDRNLAF